MTTPPPLPRPPPFPILPPHTLGRGQRSRAASCRLGTSGTRRRLGSTRYEEMVSMIIVSDMELWGGVGGEGGVSVVLWG